MTIGDRLQQALANSALFSSGEQTVEVQEDGQTLACQLTALDSMSCAFVRLSLEADSLRTMTVDQLKKTAERLSSRLTYLLEPISPIETDAQGCVVQMRSNPPQKESDRTTYYELLVSRDGQISLCRYSRTVGEQRQVIAANVTREVLLRLAGDFSAAA